MATLEIRPACMECHKILPEAIKVETYPTASINMDAVFRVLVFAGWRINKQGFVCLDCYAKDTI